MKNTTHPTESRLADLIRTAPHAHPVRDALLALALFAGLLGFILNFTSAVAPIDDPLVALGVSHMGTLQLEDDVVIDAQTIIAAADTATIAPTGSYQPLSASGNVTIALSASGYTAGSLLHLINTSNVTILISDTGTTKAS